MCSDAADKLKSQAMKQKNAKYQKSYVLACKEIEEDWQKEWNKMLSDYSESKDIILKPLYTSGDKLR